MIVGLLPLAGAVPGSLDPSFDPGTGVDLSVFSVAADGDGKVLIGGDFGIVQGRTRSGLARLNADGTFDAEFVGRVGGDESVYPILRQSDGKILIAGFFSRVNGTQRTNIARLNSDGALDDGFDAGAGPDDLVLSLALQSDGRILLGGYFTAIDAVDRPGVARLNADGGVDEAFDPGTGVSGELSGVFSIVTAMEGKVLIGGSFTNVNEEPHHYIACLNSDGSLAGQFNAQVGVENAGVLPGVYALAVQKDGKILIAGDFTSVNDTGRTNLARLNADGTLDADFATGTDFTVDTLLLQEDGRILIGGEFTSVNGVERNGIARLQADGSLDRDFDPGTGPDGPVYALAVQADGKVLLGGSFANVDGVPRRKVARLNGDKPPTAPLLFKPTRGSDTSFSVSVATVSGRNYSLEFKDALTASAWTALPAVPGDGTVKVLTDPAATASQRFYRVRVR